MFDDDVMLSRNPAPLHNCVSRDIDNQYPSPPTLLLSCHIMSSDQISVISNILILPIFQITELIIMASSNSHQMDVDRQEDEEEWYNVNNEQITSMALGLQNRLSKLKLEILQAKARNKASQTNNGSLQLEDDGELFGEGADIVTDQLHKITKERTQTFLNFTSLSAAKKAAQASKAIIEAFNLEKGGKINLEKEEEDYLKSLLEEQKELIKDVLGQHKKGAEHDLEIIMSRIQLSKLFSRYCKDNCKS